MVQRRIMPTAAQFRAARAMLRWTVEQAAERANVSIATVARAEDESRGVSARSRRRLVVVYEAEGIEFLTPEDHGAGVRFRHLS
jgi:transcriptional regulator with XRE-family HTH domain